MSWIINRRTNTHCVNTAMENLVYHSGRLLSSPVTSKRVSLLQLCVCCACACVCVCACTGAHTTKFLQWASQLFHCVCVHAKLIFLSEGKHWSALYLVFLLHYASVWEDPPPAHCHLPFFQPMAGQSRIWFESKLFALRALGETLLKVMQECRRAGAEKGDVAYGSLTEEFHSDAARVVRVHLAGSGQLGLSPPSPYPPPESNGPFLTFILISEVMH